MRTLSDGSRDKFAILPHRYPFQRRIEDRIWKRQRLAYPLIVVAHQRDRRTELHPRGTTSHDPLRRERLLGVVQDPPEKAEPDVRQHQRVMITWSASS